MAMLNNQMVSIIAPSVSHNLVISCLSYSSLVGPLLTDTHHFLWAPQRWVSCCFITWTPVVSGRYIELVGWLKPYK